jgi:hypothetical protein
MIVATVMELLLNSGSTGRVQLPRCWKDLQGGGCHYLHTAYLFYFSLRAPFSEEGSWKELRAQDFPRAYAVCKPVDVAGVK